MNVEALKELLYKMADDLLILGHRNSEWTGLGPMLEEDIAFSSMAQDKIGQSHVLYQMLNELGEEEPDTVAFMRTTEQFHNAQLCELPIGEYEFSLMRHFLFDHADWFRWESLRSSSIEPLSQVAGKFRGELRYHTMHAKSIVSRLANANEESQARLQQALDAVTPYMLGVFEHSPFEQELIEENIFEGEDIVRERWMQVVQELIGGTPLTWDPTVAPKLGGRKGVHTEHLPPLLEEMGEVFRIDPTAEW